jgi:hypothetical protein
MESEYAPFFPLNLISTIKIFIIIEWSKEPRPQGGALKHKTEIPKQVRDDKKTRTKPSCHAELVSASDLFFLLTADALFIPVHRTGFSGAILIKITRNRSCKSL